MLARFKQVLSRVWLLSQFCHDCGITQQAVWTVPDGLWYAVTGRVHGPHYCMECFSRRALRQGLHVHWQALDVRDQETGITFGTSTPNLSAVIWREREQRKPPWMRQEPGEALSVVIQGPCP